METKLSYPSYVRPPTPEELESLAALQDNPHFEVIIQWLLNSTGDADVKLRNLTDVPMIYRTQSAVNTIMSIVSYAGTARATIKEIKEKQSGSALKRNPRGPEQGMM